MSSQRASLQKRYDQMWSAAIHKIRAGRIETDPVLAAGLPDRRRGLSLIARPSAMVRQETMRFLRELRRLEPCQHYYSAGDFHLTVLSPFVATTRPGRFFARTNDFVAAADAALAGVAPVRIELRGITASSGAIMVQGFFENGGLNEIRDNLRQELRRRGLAEGLDGRYRLETAHMTVMRFRDALADADGFALALEKARERPFGAFTIKTMQLVKNDWYMTRALLRTVKRFRLAGSRR